MGLWYGPRWANQSISIMPQRRLEPQESTSDTLAEKEAPSPSTEDKEEPPDQLEMEQFDEKEKEKHQFNPQHVNEPELEAYDEGDQMIVEDEEGNVVSVDNIRGESPEQKQQHILDDVKKIRSDTSGEYAKGKFHPHEKTEGEEMKKEVADDFEHPGHAYDNLKRRFGNWKGWGKKDGDAGLAEPKRPKPPEHKRGAAHAYQFGNTIIVEDEDGEVIKKYEIPPASRGRGRGGAQNAAGGLDMTPVRQGLKRMGTWAGMGGKGDAEATDEAAGEASAQSGKQKRKKSTAVDPDDDRIRFTVGTGGRRLSKQDFINQIAQLDPRVQVAAVEESDVPEAVKRDVRDGLKGEAFAQPPVAARRQGRSRSYQSTMPYKPTSDQQQVPAPMPEVQEAEDEDRPQGPAGLTLVDSNNQDIPFHATADTVNKHSVGKPETAAQRRRRMAVQRKDSDDDGTPRIPPHRNGDGSFSRSPPAPAPDVGAEAGESQAERRRRLAALGESGGGADEDSSDSDDSEGPRQPKKGHMPVAEPGRRRYRDEHQASDSPTHRL